MPEDHFRAVLDLLAFLSSKRGKKRLNLCLRPDLEHLDLLTATINKKHTEESHPATNHGHQNWTSA
jgi:hypothetical protein